MFTYLNRPPNQECVYNLLESTVDHRSRGPPIYRSRFYCMVRDEANAKKTGCYKTMGIPKYCLCPPENYLKKNSRAPITIRPPAVPRVKICSEPPPPCPCPEQSEADPCDPCAQSPCQDYNENPECDTTAAVAGDSSCDLAQSGGDDCNGGGDYGDTCCFVAKPRVPRLCCNAMKPPIPSPCVGFDLIPRGCKNYIHSNRVKAIRMPARKPALRYVDHPKGDVQPWCDSGYPRKYVYKETFGCVPSYIQDIKEELYRNDLQAKYDMKYKERDVQAQTRHLEPTEHQALVCGLKKNWEEAFYEFQRLPLQIDTAGKREKKKMLEEELKKLEQDIQTLERHDHIFVSDTCRSFYLA